MRQEEKKNKENIEKTKNKFSLLKDKMLSIKQRKYLLYRRTDLKLQDKPKKEEEAQEELHERIWETKEMKLANQKLI